jgi:hypothetical protein
MKEVVRNEFYSKAKCDWMQNAAVTADADCFHGCKMPCPYDKEKSPCQTCDIPCSEKIMDNCKALERYKKDQYRKLHPIGNRIYNDSALGISIFLKNESDPITLTIEMDSDKILEHLECDVDGTVKLIVNNRSEE